MKKFLLICSVSLLTLPALPAIAQEGEVASLGDVLSSMSPAQLQSFQQEVTSGAGLSSDVSFAIDQASVSQALEAGVITQTQASIVNQILEISDANAESFDFDLERLIAEEINAGNINADEAVRVLTAFNSLDDADKVLAGTSEFNPYITADYNELSASGKEVVETFLRGELTAEGGTDVDALTYAELVRDLEASSQ